MTIKIDLANQVRQTVLPRWKPLLPLFEAVMNSVQAIRDAKLEKGIQGRIVIEVERERILFEEESAPVVGFTVVDNGIGLDDTNFDSFNTAFSSRKQAIGGKGLGRFTWLKAFERAQITSTFLDVDGPLTRAFTFDEGYDLDERGLPVKAAPGTATGTRVQLVGLRSEYKDQVPRSPDILAHKLIEHFLLVLLEPECPLMSLVDQGQRHSLNEIFQREFKGTASTHAFEVDGVSFSLHGFRLPTSRTTKHKLVYAADQRAVLSDKLEDFVPNLSSRLEDENGVPFFYLAVLQSPYLNEHVAHNRTDFDFDSEDADRELDLAAGQLIARSRIREQALELIQSDLQAVLSGLNDAKLDKIKRYVHQEAPQYRILLKYAPQFLDRLSPSPTKSEIETVLHKELHLREVNLRREGTRIIREAGKIEDYDAYHARLASFLDQYNELGVSALAQYVGHRKIILEFLERSIGKAANETRYPLEEVVHKLVFPMRGTSEEIPYHEQNLWIVDERLTYHSLIASDEQLRSIAMLESRSAKRGDIVIFDEKILFADVDPAEHPINSITTIEFKRPGRDDYTIGDNPLTQAFALVDEIRKSQFKIGGRAVPVSNAEIPANIYCICDLTPSLRHALAMLDALQTPDGQSYYGFHKTFKAYYEVMDYTKMLLDAKKRNRIFFDKLNLAVVDDRKN